MAEPSQRGRALRAVALLAAAAVGAGLALWAGPYPFRLLGAGAALASLLLALPWLADAYPFVKGTARLRGREIDLEDLGRRLVPPLLLVVLSAALFWPLLLGQMPRSQDHTVHLARAWIFLHELLGSGRVTGWSSIWFAGYPAGQLYAPGVDLWVTAFRLLELGLPDPSVSYAHAFLVASTLGSLSVYWLALRATGSRLAALAAGLLWTLDPGAYRQGGWSFTVYWGVWAQVLGVTFSTLAIATLDRLLDAPGPRRLAACGLFVGAALLAHPMSVLSLAVLAPAALAARAAYGPWPKGGLALSLGAGALGAGVAAWWLLPFLSRGAWTIKVPEAWRTMDAAAEALLRGAPVDNLVPLVGGLALVGAVIGARERRPLVVALGLAALVFFFASTTTAFAELRLGDLSGSFERVIYERLSMPAKVCLFTLAGHGTAAILRLGRAAPAWPSSARRVGIAALAGLVTAPFLLHGLPVLGRAFYAGVGSLELASSEPDTGDYRAFLEWSRAEWEGRDRFYRIAYLQPRNEHFMADAPVYNHTPAYKVGWTPATAFRLRPESDDPEVLEALSVRYVVARRPLGGRHLRPERAFGRIHVYRLQGERAERFHLEGPGEAEALAFEEERVRIRVASPSQATKLTLHVANYADWHASLDGEPLEIRTVPIYGDRYPTFMQVDVPRAGVVELRFTRPPLRIACEALSVLALVIAVLLALAPRVARLRAVGGRLAPAGRLVVRLAPPLVAAVASLGLVLAVARWAAGGGGDLPALTYSFEEGLGDASATLGRGEGAATCRQDRAETKLVCPGAPWSYVGAKRLTIAARERDCLWAHPTAGRPLTIEFPEVPLGARVVGRHGLDDFAATQTPEGTPVRLEVAVEGGPRRTFEVPNEVGYFPFELDTSSLAGERRAVTLTVTSDDDDRRHYCFAGGVAGGP